MDIIKDICNYLEYLKAEHDIYISLHPMAYENVIGATDLINYNLHYHPFCTFLKTNGKLRNHCVKYQQKVFQCFNEGVICGTCHAGVYEFLYPIYNGARNIGFISVSGYKTQNFESYVHKISEKYGLDKNALKERYVSDLNSDIPQKAELDKVIHPLVHLLSLAYLTAPKAPIDLKEDTYTRLLHWINIHFTSSITLEDIAKEFCFSKSYISHLFKTRNGMNFSQYINCRRIECAKPMLIKTKLSITEIAYFVGFSDSNYFTVVFKQFEGVSPTQYRKDHIST